MDMASQEGKQLAQLTREKMAVMNRLCKGVEEATASKAPEGRWTPKEIISHLIGPEGIGTLAGFQLILQQDTPLIEIVPADSFFTGKRKQMPFSDLLAEFNAEYNKIADLVETLSDEQLARKAHIPLFKELPMGEYPSLLMFGQALVEYHLSDHINHMGEILKGLGVSVPA
jgi:hypothetical protein